MTWRTTAGTFLVSGRATRIPFIHGGVGLDGGERFEEAAAFYEISESGELVKKYNEPYPFSIEDEMTVSDIHHVIGDTLYRFYWSQQWRRDVRITSERCLHGLREFPGVLPFDLARAIRTIEDR